MWTIHWYTRDGFRDLARAAGLEVVEVQDDEGRPAAHDASDVTFVLRAAR